MPDKKNINAGMLNESMVKKGGVNSPPKTEKPQLNLRPQRPQPSNNSPNNDGNNKE